MSVSNTTQVVTQQREKCQGRSWAVQQRAGHAAGYLREVQLQLPAGEVGVMQLDPRSRCRFGLAEVYADSSKAFKQLKGDLVIVDGEEGLKLLLQTEEWQDRQNGAGKGKTKQNKNKPLTRKSR